LEEQALVLGTKQSKQAQNKGDKPESLVSLLALSACLPCLPAYLACLLHFVFATSACSSKWIFAAAIYSTNKEKQGRQYVSLISLFNTMSVRVFDEDRHQDPNQRPLWLSDRVFENKQENKKMLGSIPSPVKLKNTFLP
jgi:hypothetical protein